MLFRFLAEERKVFLHIISSKLKWKVWHSDGINVSGAIKLKILWGQMASTKQVGNPCDNISWGRVHGSPCEGALNISISHA